MQRMMNWICVLSVMLLMSCGQLDVNEVVRDIEQKLEKLEAYQAKAKMIMHTGQEPQTYDIEIWYKSPEFYRIYLANEGKDISQIILKNEEGVFVLTPELKKSFRFQSNWPEQQSQVYLYQSLMKSIQQDEQRTMAIEGEHYLMQVKADYAHEMLTKQRIWLSQKNLTPKRVEVIDQQQKKVIQVEFTTFDLEPQFEENAFDRERNLMHSMLNSLPTHVSQAENPQPTSSEEAQRIQFGVIEPSYIPHGSVKQDISEMKIGDKPAILLRYKGAYHFSLIEQHVDSTDVHMGQADIVDLGHTTGLLSGTHTKNLTWMTDGVEFRIYTNDLPVSEIVKIAKSIEGQTGK
jgi:outer membrane lipoprotein-sorting protein